MALGKAEKKELAELRELVDILVTKVNKLSEDRISNVKLEASKEVLIKDPEELGIHVIHIQDSEYNMDLVNNSLSYDWKKTTSETWECDGWRLHIANNYEFPDDVLYIYIDSDDKVIRLQCNNLYNYNQSQDPTMNAKLILPKLAFKNQKSLPGTNEIVDLDKYLFMEHAFSKDQAIKVARNYERTTVLVYRDAIEIITRLMNDCACGLGILEENYMEPDVVPVAHLEKYDGVFLI